MKTEREKRQHNRQTELQRVYDFAINNKESAFAEIDQLYARAKELRVVIAQSEETIEQCKVRAVEQGVLHIL